MPAAGHVPEKVLSALPHNRTSVNSGWTFENYITKIDSSSSNSLQESATSACGNGMEPSPEMYALEQSVAVFRAVAVLVPAG